MADSLALHSRVVFWLKILLPLAALAILSTLFLLARVPPGERADRAAPDLSDLAERPRLTAPEFSGVTSDGASLTVRAAEARPADGKGGSATASAITALYERADGFTARIAAAAGAYAPDDATVTFTGDVMMETSSGYTVRSEEMAGRVDRLDVTGNAPVEIEAPFGTIDAGAMRLEAQRPADGHDVLVFTGGVRLLYHPPSPSPSAAP